MKEKSSVLTVSALAGALVLALAVLVCFPAHRMVRASTAIPIVQTAQTASPAPPQKGPATEAKTAGEAFKNVQVLKDFPADQLIPAMQYITVALGVGCDFCHDTKNFASDDKDEKGRARDMMKMMFAIDDQNFQGHTIVTCYTCHRGASKPLTMPVLSELTVSSGAPAIPKVPPMGARGEMSPAESPSAMPPSAAKLPTVTEILQTNQQSLGGAEAIQKLATLNETGTVTFPEPGLHASMDVYRKAPDKALAILHTPHGDVTEGFDGTVGWDQRGRGEVREEMGDELVRLKEWASILPGLDLQTDFSRDFVNGIEKVGNQDAYRLVARQVGGGPAQFFFDTKTGLLLRFSELIESPLGSLPQETDYLDYRDVNGVKVPFTIQVVRANGTTTYNWDHVEANVPVNENRFEKPAAEPAKE